MAAIVALGTVVWVERAALLRSAANAWIVSDEVGPADAVAIFGGGPDDRPFAAADYYRRGLVKTILIANDRLSPSEKIGAVPTSVEANREVLLKLGVPEASIATFGNDLSNTHEEVLALQAWAQAAGARSIIVPTELFSARRLRWALHHVFGDGVTIRVPALERDEFGRDDWWRHEGGVVAFQNEVLKYLYYRIKY